MKQLLLRLGALAVFLITVQPAIASSPVILGEVSGVELCAQSGCDAAISPVHAIAELKIGARLDFFGLPCSTTRCRARSIGPSQDHGSKLSHSSSSPKVSRCTMEPYRGSTGRLIW
jgi:hypothetical protein